MSKRSMRKVRHFFPAPAFKDRVLSGKAIEDGGDEISLIDIWRSNNPKHSPSYQEKLSTTIEVMDEENEQQ